MHRALPTALLWLLASALVAADWPQWRGPHLDGTSPETGLPLTWGPDDNVAWRLPLPARSGATPIVAGDRIFLPVGYEPQENDALELWCVDRVTGAVRWKRPLGGGNTVKNKQQLSSPSPVTDGERVWVMTGTGVVKAFTVAGEELWARDLAAQYGPFGHKWGYASSPLLAGDGLFVQVLHGWYTDAPSYLLRLDKATGETVWRVERPEQAVGRESPDAYTTPALWRHGRGTQIVVAGADVLTGHDAASGRELWRLGGLNPDGNQSQRLVASPLVTEGTLFAFGRRGPVLAFAPGEEVPRPAWSWDKGTDVPTPVSDGRYLYLMDDKGILWCLEARTGEVVYGPERLAVGTYSASPVLADGRLYAVAESGVTTVVRAGPRFEILATNRLEGFTLSTPAIAGGRIFLRTADALYAIGGAAPAPPAAAGR